MSSPLRLPTPITPTRIRSLAPFARFGSRYGIAALARPALVNVRREMFSLMGSSLYVLWSGSQKEIGRSCRLRRSRDRHRRRYPPRESACPRPRGLRSRQYAATTLHSCRLLLGSEEHTSELQSP